jgi:hypothetical protein
MEAQFKILLNTKACSASARAPGQAHHGGSVQGIAKPNQVQPPPEHLVKLRMEAQFKIVLKHGGLAKR